MATTTEKAIDETTKVATSKNTGIYTLQPSDGSGTLITHVQLKDEAFDNYDEWANAIEIGASCQKKIRIRRWKHTSS